MIPHQKGFIPLSPTLIGVLAVTLVVAGLGIALKVQSARLESEKADHAATKQEYAVFVSKTKALGEEAKAKVAAEIKRQKEVNDASSKSYERRLADLHSAYGRLRDQSGAGGSGVPAIPAAPIVVDDPASRDRLLEVLRAADEQTLRLIELQDWVRQQAQ